MDFLESALDLRPGDGVLDLGCGQGRHAIPLAARGYRVTGVDLSSAGAKRQRYSEARGECGEMAAAAELLGALELMPAAEAAQLLGLAGRVGAMLTRLVQRLG